jgi:hypothetical protein
LVGGWVVEPRDGGRVYSPIREKAVQHPQHLLLPEVDDVQTLGKGMEANMLIRCERKVRQH